MDLKLNIYKDKKGSFYGGVEDQKADLFTIADAIDANAGSIERVNEKISILEKVTSEEFDLVKAQIAKAKTIGIVAIIIAVVALIAALV